MITIIPERPRSLIIAEAIRLEEEMKKIIRFQGFLRTNPDRKLHIVAVQRFTDLSQERNRLISLLKTMPDDSEWTLGFELYVPVGIEFYSATHDEALRCSTDDSDLLEFVNTFLESPIHTEFIISLFHWIESKDSTFHDHLFIAWVPPDSPLVFSLMNCKENQS